MDLAEDIVKLATGSLVDVQLMANDLREAGIEARLVGDDLTAGLGTAMVGSVELWVPAADAARAEAIVRRFLDGKPATNPQP